MENREEYINNFLENALAEDIGDGDHTSLACIPDTKKGKAELLVKQNGIFAGIDIAKRIFFKVDNTLQFKPLINDGDKIKIGDIAFIVEGRVISILTAERLVLNTIQRMSGIATITNQYVKKIKGLNTKILDTRKTAPGMRLLEKEAVKIGGGKNHRMGLFDMILIKDNHIDFAGGIENAIKTVHEYLNNHNKNLKIEIEARNLKDVKTLIKLGGIDIILLDNFNIQNTKKAVELINGKTKIESSGNITLENIREYAKCGVDYISVGALTHQIQSLDMSLKAIF
ncbi:MAG: carboxylating nicotinate-nucleotide diphosphorylase [Bacteroidales bacterium]|nr:carboxylating nicotinate-nucleotide diphosphorylase [Bacteroidales bacterium]